MFIWMSVVSLLVAVVSAPLIIRFLSENGITKQNYKKELIPVGTGLLFPWTFVATIVVASLISKFVGSVELYDRQVLPLTILLIGCSFTGFIDDRLSNENVRGIFNHLKFLLKGTLTSGGIKAIFGLTISLFVALFLYDDIARIAFSTLIIAFSMNAINLIDLRPGRALKTYIFTALFLFVLPLMVDSAVAPVWHFQLALIMPAIVLLSSDSRAKSMLGDTGSNALGAILGFILASNNYSLPLNGIILGALILFNLVTDRWSLSKFLERTFRTRDEKTEN